MTTISPPPRTRLIRHRLTIPEIREEMVAIAQTIEAAHPDEARRLRFLSEETKRRHHGRRASTKHAPLEEGARDAIRQYAVEHPEAHLQDIAVLFGTNAGRVSEALHGKR